MLKVKKLSDMWIFAAVIILTSIFLVVCFVNFAADLERDDEVGNSAQSVEDQKKVVINVHNYLNNSAFVTAINEVQKMDKYRDIVFEVTGKDEEYETTMPVKVASGHQFDIVAVYNPILLAKYAKAGTIIPIDEYITNANINYIREFGRYAASAAINGKTYMIPQNPTKWVLFYNKKIFDDAKVPYPDADKPMTWDEYRGLAARLTSGSGQDKIYGALHLDWPMYWYGEAIMVLGGGERFYTEGGWSNIENPAFVNALEDTYRMMHEDESIPTYSDIKTTKIISQSFFSGRYAMFAAGPWFLNWAMDKETYPRSWEIGICPLPVDTGERWKTWGVCGGLAICPTSPDPQLAFDIAMDLERVMAKYTTTEPAAVQTVEQTNLFIGAGEVLGPEGMTAEVIQKYFLAEDQIFITEKVTGPNSSDYEQVINEEVEKYLVQVQDLVTTIKNIKERSDKVIKEH